MGWRVAGAALVVIALGAVWITWPLWSPSLPGWLRDPLAPMMEAGRGRGPDTRIAAVEKKLAAIESDLAALKRDIAARPPGATGPDNLADAVKALGERAAATDRAVAELRERAAHVEPIENRLAALDAAIKALPAQPGAPATPAAPVADAAALSRLQSDTQTSIGALRQQDQTLAGQLAGAEKRIAALEARAMAAGTASRETAFVLAVGQLREAVRSGRPFADALAGLRAIAGDDREPAVPLAALQPFAGSGVADLATLRARFALAAQRIVAAAPRAGAWWDQTLARLSSLVSIRRTGPAAAAGQGAEAAVARAELALGGGDIAAAVKDLEGLSGPAADAAAPWLAGARGRLAADAAVAALESIAVGRLGGVRAPAAAGASGG